MKTGLLASLLGLLSSVALAHLTVIATTGPTVPAKPYLGPFQSLKETVSEQAIKTNPAFTHPKPIAFTRLAFPAKSPLTAGPLVSRALKTHWVRQPLFVIGDDPRSIQWAVTNARTLNDLHALGLITNVRSAERVAVIERQTGLILNPVSLSGDGLPVSHYPFLLTATDLEQ